MEELKNIIRQQGGWNKVEMYGPLTRRNFNSDEAFNFFKLGGGNAQLKRNRYDVKKSLCEVSMQEPA